MAKKVIAMSVDLPVDFRVDFSLLPDELSHLVFEIAGVDIPEFVFVLKWICENEERILPPLKA